MAAANAWFDGHHDDINNAMIIGTCDAHTQSPATITTNGLPDQATVACNASSAPHRYVDIRIAPELYALNNDKRPPLKTLKPAIHSWKELQEALRTEELHGNDLEDSDGDGPDLTSTASSRAHSRAHSHARSHANSHAHSHAEVSGSRASSRAGSHVGSRASSRAGSRARSRAGSGISFQGRPSAASDAGTRGDVPNSLANAIKGLGLNMEATGQSTSAENREHKTNVERGNRFERMELNPAFVTDSPPETPGNVIASGGVANAPVESPEEDSPLKTIVVWIANSPKTRYFSKVTAAGLKHLGTTMLRYGFALGVNYPSLVHAWGARDGVAFASALKPVMALCWKDGLIEAVLGRKVSDTLGMLLASDLSVQQLQAIADTITGTPSRGIGVPSPGPAHAAKQRHLDNAARARKYLEEKEARVRDGCP